MAATVERRLLRGHSHKRPQDATRREEACCYKSPLGPLCSLPDSANRITWATRAYDHCIKVACKQTSLDLGGRTIKALVPSVCGGKTTTTTTTAGARSSKMLVLEVTRWEMTGNSFSLLRQQKRRAACVPVFENLQMLLSPHISISLFRQHLKACLPFSQALSFFGGTHKAIKCRLLPLLRSLIGNVEWILRVTMEEKKKCANSNMWASVKLFPVVFFKKNVPCALLSVMW